MKPNLSEKILDTLLKIFLYLLLWLLLMIPIGILLSFIGIFGIYKNIFINTALIILTLFFTIWMLITFVSISISILANIWSQFIQRDIEKLNKAILSQSSIDTILKISEKMLSHVKFMYIWKKIWNLSPFYGVRRTINRNYIEKTRKILSILEAIKHKLNQDIDNIQKRIEESRDNLMTLKWNSELASLQNSQKIRLDRQIEQFEELQKVLN